jgi:hypothetical protein
MYFLITNVYFAQKGTICLIVYAYLSISARDSPITMGASNANRDTSWRTNSARCS